MLWGLYHGAFQVLERLGFNKTLKKHPIFSHFYCLFVVVCGWVLFRSESVLNWIRFLLRMLLPWKYGIDKMFMLPSVLTTYSGFILIIAIIGSGILQSVASRFPAVQKWWKHSYVELLFLCLVFGYSIIRLASGTYNPFIYFRF